jgi:CheY-like chemotaxis protein
MSAKILIVESDLDTSNAARSELEGRGFSVEETADARGSIEQIRHSRPSLVVLAVELGAGQNGYLICSKLKKDPELKDIPLIIIGPPVGFEKHRKLKNTRAEDYLSKPLDPVQLADAVSALIGAPKSLPLDQVAAPTPAFKQRGADEEPTLLEGDPDLEMLDAAFDHALPPDLTSSESTEPPSESESEIYLSVEPELNGDGTVQQLRSEVEALRQSSAAAQERAAQAEARALALEAQLATRAGPGGTKTPGGKSDRDYFALRETLNKKDREILQLKTELTDREKQILEFNDQETHVEQRVAELSEVLNQRDSELADSQDKLAATESDLSETREKLAAAEVSTEDFRSRAEQFELAMQQAQNEAAEVRGELEALRSELQNGRTEAESIQLQFDQAKADLESAEAQLASQASRFAEETESMRNRLAEIEASSAKQEERIEKLHQRIKSDEKLREKTKKALSIALQLLDEQESLAGKKTSRLPPES